MYEYEDRTTLTYVLFLWDISVEWINYFLVLRVVIICNFNFVREKVAVSTLRVPEKVPQDQL